MDHAKPNGTCTLFQCGGGVTEWEARPDVFPDGMAAVHDSIGKPLVVHNRFFSFFLCFFLFFELFCFFVGFEREKTHKSKRYWSNDNVYTNYSFHFGKFEALPTVFFHSFSYFLKRREKKRFLN